MTVVRERIVNGWLVLSLLSAALSTADGVGHEHAAGSLFGFLGLVFWACALLTAIFTMEVE